MRTQGLPLETFSAYSSRRRFNKAYIFLDLKRGSYQVVYNSRVAGLSRVSGKMYTYAEAKEVLDKF